MIGLKKRNIKKMLKLGAKAGGVSFADVQTDIEATIDETMTSTDPQVQENFIRLPQTCSRCPRPLRWTRMHDP